MIVERLFVDTSFLLAVMNKNDQEHQRARTLLPRVGRAKLVLTTEAVLVEVGNAFGRNHRGLGSQLIEQYLDDSRDPESGVEVVPIDTRLLRRGLEIYRKHQDKEWGLTDCISFVVMREHGLTDALTADRHFVQAGFRALMREA